VRGAAKRDDSRSVAAFSAAGLLAALAIAGVLAVVALLML